VKRAVHLTIGVVASVGFGWLALRSVDLGAVLTGIRHANVAYIGLAVALVLLAFVLRGLRWQAMFDGALTLRVAMWTTLVGLFLNAALPVRAGEVGRALAVRQVAAVPLVQGLTATIVERIVDVAALALLLIVTWPSLPSTVLVRTLALGSAALLVASIALVVGAVYFLDRAQAIVARLIRRVATVGEERKGRARASIRAGLHAARNRRAGLRVLSLSLASWVVLAFANWACLRALGVSAPWSAAVLVLVATNFASILPSTAGSLGVFEAAARAALASYGVSATTGATAAIVIHGVNLLPAIALGIVASARLGLDIRELRHDAEEPQRLAAEPESATIQP
jgi:uncharacterized protein (TIRG00374 family)